MHLATLPALLARGWRLVQRLSVCNSGSLRTRKSNRPSKHLPRIQDLGGGRSFLLNDAQVQARSAAAVPLVIYGQVQDASGRCSCPCLLYTSTPFISSVPFLLLYLHIHIHITSQPSLLTQSKTNTILHKHPHPLPQSHPHLDPANSAQPTTPSKMSDAAHKDASDSQ